MLNKAIKKAKENKKGFTLAELLIVVAIIAVLVAISIPIFNAQLEKSREATDMANIRAAYAEVAADALTDPDNNHTATVSLKQTQAKWQTDTNQDIAGVKLSAINNENTIKKGGSVTVEYTAGTNGTGTIKIAGVEVTSSFKNNNSQTDQSES